MDSKKLVWRRGSCLDEETCEACRNADGTIISGEDAKLDGICTIPFGCRSIQYSNADGNRKD